MYTPNNPTLFTAVYASALAALGASLRNLNSVNSAFAPYVTLATVAGAYAHEFDTVWGTTVANQLVVDTAQELTYGTLEGRWPMDAAAASPSYWSANVNAAIALIQTALAYFTVQAIPEPPANTTLLVYGSGQDGDFHFDGIAIPTYAVLVGTTYTVNRDVFPNNWIIDVGITVDTGGFHTFGAGTCLNNGTVSRNGNNAAGGVAGAASALGTLGIGTAGGAGHANGAGSNGTAQSNTLQDAAASGQCHGGAGGAGGANAGGTAGAYSVNTANGGSNYLVPMLTGFSFSQTSGGNQAQTVIIGGGSGGGGGGSDNAGVTGGGGGGGGGVLHWVFFQFINNGIMEANGGNGASASGVGGNGGGGGGGGGGVILSLSRFRSGSGAMLVAGGLGGAAVGTGVAGTSGATGHINLFTA